jgi:uncharacterized membrane protein YagU involved in acid resistance
MKRLLLGAAAGTVATVPMTMLMETLHERTPGEPAKPMPPREVAEGLTHKAGVRHALGERDMQILTLATHVGYGAAVGAVFGVVAPRNPVGAIASGLLFGLTVWAGSYLGWLPAFGVRHAATQDPPARSGIMIAAHLVWGAAAGSLLAASTPERARGRRHSR